MPNTRCAQFLTGVSKILLGCMNYVCKISVHLRVRCDQLPALFLSPQNATAPNEPNTLD